MIPPPPPPCACEAGLNRRGTHGRSYYLESTSGSLEKCENIEGNAEVSSGSDDVLSFVESGIECGREWLDGLSPDSTRRGSVYHTGDNRLAKLDVCREKVGRDWWSFAYGYSIAPSFHQNSLEASSSK